MNTNFVLDLSLESTKAHFYVFCPTCKSLQSGKIRVRCNFCKGGAFTVHSDPQNWTDVLEPKRITGLCENDKELCENVSQSIVTPKLIVFCVLKSVRFRY